MYKDKFKGKVLVVFSDPGGAKPLLSFVKLNNLEEKSYIVSDRSYLFYKNFELEVHSTNNLTPNQILERELPDYVITGTSYTSKIELEFLKATKEKGIVSYSFLDHYTNFIERFMISETERVLPDNIFVTDQKAYDIAMTFETGVNIIISGNFYHEFLKEWVPQIDIHQFRKELNITEKQKIMLFAPDPLSNVGGNEVFGFDELSVFKSLEQTLIKYNTDDFVIIAVLHPNQNRDYILPSLKASKLNVIVNETYDLNTLIYYADVVVSMFSNILIEALILNRSILRYMIGYKQTDPFEGQMQQYTVHDEVTLASSFDTILK